MAEFKKVTEVPEITEVGENDTVLVVQNGDLKRAPAAGLNGGGIVPLYYFGSDGNYDFYLDKAKETVATPYDILKAMAAGNAAIYQAADVDGNTKYKGPNKPLFFCFSNAPIEPPFLRDDDGDGSYIVTAVRGTAFTSTPINKGSYTAADWNEAAEQLAEEL